MQLVDYNIENYPLVKRLVTNLIKYYISILNQYIGNWDGMTNKELDNKFVHYFFNPDHLINLLMVLCVKYPLLIPYVIDYQISLEEMEKQIKLPCLMQHIRSSNQNADYIPLSEYIIQTSFLLPTAGRLFLKLITRRNYAFSKNSEGKTVSSGIVNRRRFVNKLQNELLKACEPDYFVSQINCERFRTFIYMLATLAYLNYDNQPLQNKKLQTYQLLQTFNRIAENIDVKNACILINTQFFVLFRYVYKAYIKLLFEEKAQSSYDKNAEWMKYYYNKLLDKSFFTQDSIQSQLNLAEGFQLSNKVSELLANQLETIQLQVEANIPSEEKFIDLG